MRATPEVDARSRQVAEWLMHEHALGRPFRPFCTENGIDTIPAAYRVQAEYVTLQAHAREAIRAGYKIGLTSATMQAMCSIDTPVTGVILEDRVYASGARLNRSDYGRFGVEFEIAVRLGRDLKAIDGPLTLAEVQIAIDAVAPAMEIVDDRSCDYTTLDVLSLVADNAWNAGVVLGDFRTSWPDLGEVVGSVSLQRGEILGQGRGQDVLGHPLLPVVWLANHLGSVDEGLLAGQVIMTGSMISTKFPTGPERYLFDVDGLGTVELSVH